jgi:hypothetical protein
MVTQMAESDFSQTLPAFAETSLKAARPGDHFLSERPEKCVPKAGGESVNSWLIVIQNRQKLEFMYHKNACKPRPC